MTYWLVYYKTKRMKHWRLVCGAKFSSPRDRFLHAKAVLFGTRNLARWTARWRRKDGQQARGRKLVVDIPAAP